MGYKQFLLLCQYQPDAARAARTCQRCWSPRSTSPVYVTIDGKRRKITKREAIVPQMVNKSVEVDLRVTKMGSLHESALSVRHLGRSMNGLRAVCPLHP